MAKQHKSRPSDSGSPPPNRAPSSEASQSSCPVVGIGASAGGLEAITELLSQLPIDTGMAFVLVQHLDARQGDMLIELLQRATRMPVRMATEGTSLLANCVFVNPPSSYMRIEDNHLRLEPHAAPRHLPIDCFFHSLAESRRNRSVAVILSGSASDGTMGLKAVKAEGGITFAQDDSAKHRGMPQSAISTHCVDFVLSPDAIAQELGRLSRHEYLQTVEAPPADASSNGLSDVFALLRASTNVDFTFYKHATLHRRIHRRMALNKLEDTREYAKFLQENPGELQALFQDILIHVTSFFREPATFETLRAQVFPVIFRRRSTEDPVRVWVPGCSTGEEVYSLAILILEYLRDTGQECHCQIFGTDLNDAVLDRARAGIYAESISADVSPERLRRFFIRSNGGYQISRAVRDLCIFARQNVTRDPPFSRLDLISCRNVLIYLGAALQAKVMRMFHYGLRHSGFLVLGLSEAVGAAGELFAPIDKQSRIYNKQQVRPAMEMGQELYAQAPAEPHRSVDSAVYSPAADPARMIDHLILARYSPPGVVVTRDLRVLQFRGQTSPYLEHSPGEANLQLLRMSRGGLGLEIRRLIQQADKKSFTVRSESLPVPDGDHVRNVRVAVTPVQPSGQTERQFLVVFEETGGARPEERPRGEDKTAKLTPPRRIQQLEQELMATKQYLQIVIEEQEAAGEELKSANEEIQSSNEELQSTNEELLTAKEELQSTNEELITLNEEMQGRNAELAQMNNDLFNLLTSVNIPILMLGMDLRIRRFTPQAERILSLLPTDVGRPIADLRPKIDLADLEALCREVLESLSTKEREVQDTEGRIHSMWVRPYRTAESRIDGVVLSLFDITERRQTAEARYRRMFEAGRDGMVIAQAPSGEILDVNPHFCRVTGYPRQHFIGQRFWEHPAFQDTMIDKELLEGLETEDSVHRSATLHTAQGGWVQVDLTANLYSEAGKRVVQFNIRDSGTRRNLEEKLRSGDEGARRTYRMQAVEHIADSLAHEFNDVLTSIMGHTALLQQEAGDTRAREYGRQIMRAAERAAALSRQLLVFGRPQITLPEVLDVKDVIEDVSQLLRVIASKGVEVTFDLSEPLGNIHADRGDVEQVLMNLALNARDMMPSGGTIRFAAANVDTDQQFAAEHPSIAPGKYVCVTVANRGAETAAARQNRSTLRRHPEFTKEQFSLSALFGLVSRNGGSILATSEVGSGSSFLVYFPRIDQKSFVSSSPRGGSETILVVEDDDSVRQLISEILARYGYTIIAASSGPEAVRLAHEYPNRIDLIITDALMQEMNGRELADEIRARHPGVERIFVSGHPESHVIEEGVLDDSDTFLPKPFSAEALVVKVRELLDSRLE